MIELPGNDSGGTKPFEGSAEIAAIVSDLLAHWCIQTFVETGTQRGATALWASYQGVNVVTIEADRDYFEEAKNNLEGSAVTQYLGKSHEVISALPFGEFHRVLFFLDAHGCRIGGSPLVDELLAIDGARIKYAIHPVIAIHDVQVPNHPELGFDVYDDGSSLTINRVKDALQATGFGNWHLRYNSIADGAARGFCYVTPV